MLLSSKWSDEKASTGLFVAQGWTQFSLYLGSQLSPPANFYFQEHFSTIEILVNMQGCSKLNGGTVKGAILRVEIFQNERINFPWTNFFLGTSPWKNMYAHLTFSCNFITRLRMLLHVKYLTLIDENLIFIIEIICNMCRPPRFSNLNSL